MLSRKEGSVGYVIFNNPERHNAVSLDMWQAPGACSTTSQRRRHPRGGGHRRRRQGLRVRRRHLAVREGALHEEAVDALQRGRREGYRRPPRVPEADHRDDPRLLHRRRPGPRHLLRPAHRHREFDLRGAGGQARPRLRLSGPEAAGRCGRTVVHQGDLLHGAPIHRRRGAGDGPRQPGGARRRTGELREELRRHHRRQRAADHQGGQGGGQRDGEGREQARPEAGARPRSTPASRARTTWKAATPSWRSASRCSRAADEAFDGPCRGKLAEARCSC